jgi:hypothetical protein
MDDGNSQIPTGNSQVPKHSEATVGLSLTNTTCHSPKNIIDSNNFPYVTNGKAWRLGLGTSVPHRYICADTNGQDVWVHRCLRIHMVTDVPRTKRLPMPMLTDVLGPQMFTDIDGYRCLWFTDAYAERMLMHKVWMTEIPRFRQEIPRFQSTQKPQSGCRSPTLLVTHRKILLIQTIFRMSQTGRHGG